MENPDTRGVGDAGSSSELAGIYSRVVRMLAAGRRVEAKAACEHLIAVAPRHAEGLQLLAAFTPNAEISAALLNCCGDRSRSTPMHRPLGSISVGYFMR